MLFYILYIIIIFLIWYLNRKTDFVSVFRSTEKTSWLVAGLSMFMLFASTDSAQIYSGLIYEKGISGLWLLWVGMLSTAVVPIVFAPLWAKLDFITDNQFVLFRFSGKGAKVLHQFRALYVGGIVVAFSLSFQTIAFSRILQIFFDISVKQSLLVTGGLLSLFALKNSFANKFKTDIFHAIIYFISVAVSFYYLSEYSGGLSTAINDFRQSDPDKLSLFPSSENKELLYALFVYLGIQWWSTSLFDGGGPEMARYTAPGTRWGAIKVGLTPIVLNIMVILVLISMTLMSFVHLSPNQEGELIMIEAIFKNVPHSLTPIILLGFFALFITTAESVMNWGASFITVDFYKGYIAKDKSKIHYKRFSFFVMLLLSVFSLVISFYIDSLESLIKIVFSISAGVAPVFILRWFWMRVNAWSQLAAMLSSGVYTLLFYVVQDHFQTFFEQSVLHAYEWRLIIVTILTTITWIIVTFLTPKDDRITIERFRKILPSTHEIIKSFAIAFVIGIIVLGTTVLLISLLVG